MEGTPINLPDVGEDDANEAGMDLPTHTEIDRTIRTLSLGDRQSGVSDRGGRGVSPPRYRQEDMATERDVMGAA